MILSVIQHAGALSARPRQYRQRTTLMYDAITELIKASSRNTDPVVGLGGGVVVRRRRCGGLRCVKPSPAALTALSLPNQRFKAVDWRRGLLLISVVGARGAGRTQYASRVWQAYRPLLLPEYLKVFPCENFFFFLVMDMTSWDE